MDLRECVVPGLICRLLYTLGKCLPTEPHPKPWAWTHFMCHCIMSHFAHTHSQWFPSNASTLVYLEQLRITGRASSSFHFYRWDTHDLCFIRMSVGMTLITMPCWPFVFYSNGPYTSVLGSVSNPSLQMFLPMGSGHSAPKTFCPLSLYSLFPYFITAPSSLYKTASLIGLPFHNAPPGPHYIQFSLLHF